MSRRRNLGGGLRAILAALIVMTTSEAGATPAPFGSPALYRWLTSTAAQALKASEADNDLRPGGLLAVNQSAKGGLAQISALTPDWLAEIDAHLSFRDDLSAAYGLRARRPLYGAADSAFMIDTFGRIDVDPGGRTSSELGLGLATEVGQDEFAFDLAGGLEQEWLRQRERYLARVRVDWWRLSFTGSAFNEVTMEEPSGALYEERLLDGLDLELETGLPFVPWLTLGARQSYRAPTAPNAEAWRSFRHSLKLIPVRGLEIEAGTEEVGNAEPRWFTRVRYVLKLGA